MSLAEYCRDRLVVLKPGATALEAARAMVHNGVGSVVVASQQGRVAGIVTDRDLAARCVAKGLPPAEVDVAELMTPDPLTVDIEATEEQAAALMHRLHVRRLVVVD